MDEEIAIIDFGSSYTQLIAKNIRKLGIFCRIYSHLTPPSLSYSNIYVKGIILSDGPCCVNDKDYPTFDFDTYKTIPILGICYGAQLIAKHYSGKVKTLDVNRGKPPLSVMELDDTENEDYNLFNNIEEFPISVPMSNHNTVIYCGEGEAIGSTEGLEFAAFKIYNKDIYGIQFHPELDSCEYGNFILQNFCIISNVKFEWKPDEILSIVSKNMSNIIFNQDRIKNETKKGVEYVPRVAMAVSGGLNSTVAGYLLQTIVGKYNFYPILIDNGFMRQGEVQDIQRAYQDLGFNNLRIVDGRKQFLNCIKNVSDASEKRKRIGDMFIKTFQDEVLKIEKELRKQLNKKNKRKKRLIQFVGQGTMYSDVMDVMYHDQENLIESSILKYKHNVSRLENKLKVTTLEPLDLLFKDDIKMLGLSFGLPESILNRHTFPGPGLSIRIVGKVTQERLDLVREVDFLASEYMMKHGYYQDCYQFGVILLPDISYEATHNDLKIEKKTFVIRAIKNADGINAVVQEIPIPVLEGLAAELCYANPEVSRVVYDITGKPPATIEWN